MIDDRKLADEIVAEALKYLAVAETLQYAAWLLRGSSLCFLEAELERADPNVAKPLRRRRSK